MKKIILIIMMLPFWLTSQTTYVPDDNFENYLEANGMGDGIPLNNYVLTASINGVTVLDISSDSISDLTGIEGFVSLTDLNCTNNQITNLDLSSNTLLTDLKISANLLSNINVSLLNNLTYLSCRNNQIANLDLSSNTALDYLDCSYNSLTNLDVSMLNNLTNLNCGSNSIVTLDVSQNTNLTNLITDANPISLLDLSNNTLLIDLRCYNNNLTSIDVSNCPNLWSLNLNRNSMSSIDVSNNLVLEHLYIDRNFTLPSIDLSNNISLTSLGVQYNLLSNLDVSSNVLLERIYFTGNQISNIDLTNNTELVSVGGGENNMTTLDLSQNNKINQLILYTTSSLTSLDLRNGNNSVLTYFDIGACSNLNCINVDDSVYSSNNWLYGVGNQNLNGSGYYTIAPHTYFSNSCSFSLTYVPDDNFENYLEANGMGDGIALNNFVATSNINNVDSLVIDSLNISDLTGIEDFTALNYLNCSYNSLTNFDLSNNTNLTQLFCGNNQINSIDVSNNVSLSYLYFGNNQVSTIDLTNNSSLLMLSCQLNQLSNINLTNNTLLSELNCNNNQLTSLDLNNNTNLIGLECASNQLTSLDVSNNTSLNKLFCGDNQFTSLDLINNVNIGDLRIGNNQISYIDLSPLTSMHTFDCRNNLFDSLSLTNNLLLYRLICFGNNISELDLSNYSNFRMLWAWDNDLQLLDMRNGNNTNVIPTYFQTYGNPNLSCISVDDSTYSANNWLNIDSNSVFSNNCQNYNSSSNVAIDSVVIDNDINCNGDFGDITIYVDNDTNSLGCNSNPTSPNPCGPNLYYQIQAFVDDGTAIFSSFGVNTTNASQVSVNTLLEGTYYILVVDSVAFNQAFPVLYFIPNFGTQWSTVLSHPSVLDYDSVTISQEPAPIQTIENIISPTCYGLNDGQIIITSVTGNTAPYTYLWNDPLATTGTILSNLNSGEYICTITDAIGCSEDITFLVDTVFAVVANATITSNISCYGSSDGEIIASATGGNPPYNYNWTSGQTTQTISNLSSGVYTVFVQDSNGCNDFISINIQDPNPFIVVANIVDASSLNNDGSIDITVSGATSPYSYFWSGPNGFSSSLEDITNLSSGTYSCAILDANGCFESWIGVVSANFISGCTDSTANNFNPFASVDDGSCLYSPFVYGCTDINALNYNSFATIDDSSCCYSSGQQWSQISQDIDGESAIDYSGIGVSLNSDGSSVAIGAYYNDGNGSNSGHTRVYENIVNSWSQIGQDVDGETANDISGRSVSLSSDGNTVAIGAQYNDGNGLNSGHVRLYTKISDPILGTYTWTQIGQDIDGEAAGDQSGFSVSLSDDGNIVAVGAVKNNDNGSNSGHVRLFTKISDPILGTYTWTQIGQDIDGEAAGDESGFSISINSSGTTVAIGAPGNNANGSNSGHVRVYENIAGTWTQIGQDINGEAINDYSGRAISLSADGTTVAIGADGNDGVSLNTGHVRLYTKISDPILGTYTWTQIGQDIDGESADDQSGFSVSLSDDGNIVAIGAINNDGNGLNSGHVRLYTKISDPILGTYTWTQIGQDIDGEAANDISGHSVSLSSDGNTVAIGAPSNNANGSNSGHVRIFEMPTACSELGCLDPLALNFDPYATIDDSTCIYPIYGCVDTFAINYNTLANVDDSSCTYTNNNLVTIDSINAINPILCYGDFADIAVFVDNDTSSIGLGSSFVTYQLKAFKVSSSSTFSYFSSSQTTATSIVVSGLDESTYYLLVVDSVAFNSTYNPFSQYFSNSNFINNVLNDPSVYDYDSITLLEPSDLQNTFSTLSTNNCFGDCNASEFISISGGVLPYNVDGNILLGNDSLIENLCAGSYNVAISDANGCQVSTLSSSFVISEPPLIESHDTIVTCGSYTWNGITYDSSGTYSSSSIVSNNYSLNFDGAPLTQALFPNLTTLNTGDGSYVTVSFWMDWNEYDECMPICFKYYDLIFYSGGFGFNHSQGDNYGVSDTLLTLGWQHITAVFYDPYSNENAHDFEKLYINGVEQSLSYFSPPNNGLGNPSPSNIGFLDQELLVGSIYPQYFYEFNGKMDELSIWNGELSQNQIQSLVTCPPLGNEVDLVGFWNFEQGVGTTVFDQTANGNNGTITNVNYDSNTPTLSCSLTNFNGCDSTAFLHLTITPCYGCTDSTAINFDSTATVDDGSCAYLIYGCTDSTALNYDLTANIDDGSCNYLIYGCTDSTALNYNPLATIDDSSCFYGNCQSPAPINNNVTDITDTRATLNWNNMNSSNCMVLKYVIRYRELGTNFWTTKSGGSGNGSCNFGLNNTSKVLMNLIPSTTYQYKIKAYYCFGGVSVWSLPLSFTTEDGCPPMTNLSSQTYPNNTNKVTFSWDSTGAYVFARVALRVDTIGSSWQTAGGFGVYYPTLSVNKFGLQQGQSYRAQGRTFCDSNITAFRSWWTPPMFWTQPGTIKFSGGDVIKNLEVYPNPTRDIFNISFNLDEIETIKIKIYNIIGEIVFEEDRLQFVGEYIKKIDMSKYNRGVYFLKIETENSIINKKLVLQ